MVSDLPYPRPGPPPVMPRWKANWLALRGHKIVFIHARRDMRARIRGGDFMIFNRLGRVLTEMGFGIALVPLFRPPLMRLVNRQCLHIYRGWRLCPKGRAVLVVSKGYLNGYWYVDPNGFRETASVADKEFSADQVPVKAAQQVFLQVRESHVAEGKSTREQVARTGGEVPEGAIAILLQKISFHARPPGAACSEARMIRAIVAARGGRPVVIKLHPHGATRAVRRAVAEVLDPAGGVMVTEANVHDVLEAAAVVCTMTSGAGFEALLHRTPVVLFARADFHHCTVRVQDPAGTGAALEAALNAEFPYERYIWWFLRHGVHGVWHPAFDKRISAVVGKSLAGPAQDAQPILPE